MYVFLDCFSKRFRRRNNLINIFTRVTYFVCNYLLLLLSNQTSKITPGNPKSFKGP
ncbi:hypothetical protein QW060_26635 [Myroides ceti]|uniref:Uncharacterized protein n=1 Tax=Paenimyroides ceti TaxID=395087 RepID=A0ABT8D1J6_9FLAO|nr:hypothetical protein [Paenimyroides ceti]MDN3710400.1 hypothetical protein [Paenimyroides ceti]